jgi:hypothetical protein
MAMIVAGHTLNTTEGVDKITSTDKITTAYFSNDSVQIAAAEIHSASISDTNEVYYYGISKDNSTGSIQFNVAYGNSLGYGGHSHGDDIKSPTEAIYKHWTNVLLAENEVTGGFVISSLGSSPAVAAGKDTEIYILNAKRSLMKDRLNKKNWTIVLSGSNSVNTGGATPLHLTDDSNSVIAVATPAGPRYNIVSGSQGVVSKTAAIKTYGWYYPDQGTLVFSGAELSASIPGSGSTNGLVTQYNHKDYQGFGSPGNSGNALENNNYGTALRFINCLKADSTSYMKFRDEEDLTSVSYFCRVHSGEANFSNNPTFTSGSLSEIRQTTMKGNPTVYITGVELYDTAGNVVAVGKLSTPLKKNFSSEATIKVKLTY